MTTSPDKDGYGYGFCNICGDPHTINGLCQKHQPHPTPANTTLNEILDEFEADIKNTVGTQPMKERAKAKLTTLILEIIGEDEADFLIADPEELIRNALRAEQRAKLGVDNG